MAVVVAVAVAVAVVVSATSGSNAAGGSMASNGISERLHLKAAARDIISEYFCRDSLESITAAQYADELLQAYWEGGHCS